MEEVRASPGGQTAAAAPACRRSPRSPTCRRRQSEVEVADRLAWPDGALSGATGQLAEAGIRAAADTVTEDPACRAHA
jgi:hypothetical protein